MARIDLSNIRHAYGPDPKSDADFGAQEKVAARRIVEALRLNPADFGL